MPSTLIYPYRAGNIRVPAGSCFCMRLASSPIAPSALSGSRAVGRGGASRRLRRGQRFALPWGAFGAPWTHIWSFCCKLLEGSPCSILDPVWFLQYLIGSSVKPKVDPIVHNIVPYWIRYSGILGHVGPSCFGYLGPPRFVLVVQTSGCEGSTRFPKSDLKKQECIFLYYAILAICGTLCSIEPIRPY